MEDALSAGASRGPVRRLRATAWLPAIALAVMAAGAPSGNAGTKTQGAPGDSALAAFRVWLAATHPGYGCDEGPAAFRNKTVEAAYPGQRFYYVLTYTRGIQPPFPNSVSIVATVDDRGTVVPFRPESPPSYGRGLIPIRSSKDARLAAAAVSILATCDPGERRWSYRPERFRARGISGGWKAVYDYDRAYSSWVTLDRKRGVVALGGTAPPVP